MSILSIKQPSLDLPITVIKNSVERFLSKPAGTFDFIFADPPYAFSKDQLLTLAAQLLDNNWLSKEGLLVIEHDSHLRFITASLVL